MSPAHRYRPAVSSLTARTEILCSAQNDGAGGKLTSDVSYLLVSWPSAAPSGWQNTPIS